MTSEGCCPLGSWCWDFDEVVDDGGEDDGRLLHDCREAAAQMTETAPFMEKTTCFAWSTKYLGPGRLVGGRSCS